jgi:hypothetical protein
MSMSTDELETQGRCELETRARGETIAKTVRKRIESGPERRWRVADFDDLPAPGVSQTLSRLCRLGLIVRARKGVYYQPRLTIGGPHRPNMARIRVLAANRKRVFPSGLAAANMLGFTTRIPTQIELSTTATSLPRLFERTQAVVHTHRPARWRTLSETDAALLEFLRSRGIHSALSPEETVEKLLEHFREPGRYERILKVVKTEPPRVRAMIGAIGEQLAQPHEVLYKLGDTLKPFSRFDFGILAALPYARGWLVK